MSVRMVGAALCLLGHLSVLARAQVVRYVDEDGPRAEKHVAESTGPGTAGTADLTIDGPDCNENGNSDDYDIATGVSVDCNGNGVPDECDLADGVLDDQNVNGIPDECEGTLYVDASAPPGGTGESWDSAMTALQSALTAASEANGIVTEIRIAQGTYKPDFGGGNVQGDREATFRLLNRVALRGGYVGRADPSSPDTRDPDLYETVLSGDLNGNDDPCDSLTRSENSLHVVTGSFTDATAVLEGVTITAGNANDTGSTAHQRGGGVYNSLGSPTLIDCKIIRCTASMNGGGIYSDGSLTVYGSILDGNQSRDGAGIFHIRGDLALVDCTFVRNGGGIAFSGGGVYFNGNHLRITNCRFLQNNAYSSGAISSWAWDLQITNSVFAGNTSGIQGSIVVLSGDTVLTNCTIAYNSSSEGVGGINSPVIARLTLLNCILWGNRSADDVSESAQISARADLVVRNSCIQGLDTLAGNGNIGDPPRFVDSYGEDCQTGTLDDDLRLMPGSPCADAGDNQAVPPDWLDLDGDGVTDLEPIPFDLDGSPRFTDDPCAVNSGVSDPEFPALAIVDMGAHERLFPASADSDDDGIPDCVDNCPLTANPDQSDHNGDGIGDACLFDDCNGNGVADECDADCNENGYPDSCDILDGLAPDCNENGIPDECDTDLDCNGNGQPDSCDILDGLAPDCNENGIPDGCDTDLDCNGNGHPDSCDILDGLAPDCNENGIPDECDTDLDCNRNGHPDSCDIQDGLAPDCNENGTPDECEIAADSDAPGGPFFCSLNCDVDCNRNGLPDICDIASGVSVDDNGNGIPDACHIVIYVDDSAPPGGDGTSWALAFRRLRSFWVARTSGFEVEFRVARGQYDNIELHSGTILRGGFAGFGAPDPDLRRPYDFVSHTEYVWAHGDVLGATVDGFTISGNTVYYPDCGGGVYIDGGSVTFVDCVISDHFTEPEPYCDGPPPEPTVANGAGMCILGGATVVIYRCVFARNETGRGSSGDCEAGVPVSGGAIGGDGAGIYVRDSQLLVTNSVFAFNKTGDGGGCTICGKGVGDGPHRAGLGPDIAAFNTELVVRNCTRYANERGEDGEQCPDPWPRPADGDGGEVRGSGFCVDCITWGPDGGAEPDPLLLDPLNYDFRVSSGSPAIDDGDPGFETMPGETDFAGRPRVLCGRVDRGAFEFAGDFDCDQAVGLTDHAGWQDCVTGPDLGPYASGCESFDFNTDADVDLRDHADWQNTFGL